MNIFPMIQPEVITTEELPLYKEVDWDFERNIPIYKNGSPSIVTGKRAVLVWAWKALHTPRFRYEIYTWNYGNEVELLIGQPVTKELKQSEAARYIRDCLMINPYITGVSNIKVAFQDDILSISCTLETVYGEVSISV